MSITIKNILPLICVFSGRFISAAGVFGLSVLFSRYLSLEEAGNFFEAFVWIIGLAIVLNAGLPILLIRKISPLPMGDPQAMTLLSWGMANVAILSLLTSGIWWGVAAFLDHIMTPLGLVWVALLPVAMIHMIATWFKSRERPGWGGFWEVGLISAATCCVSLIKPPQSALDGWLIFSVTAWATFGVACLMAFWNTPPKIADMKPKPQMWHEARFLWTTAILSYVAQWGGMLMSSALLGTEDIAVVNALFRTLAPLQFVILTMDFYLAPKFVRSEQSAIRKLRRFGIISGLILAAPYAALFIITPDLALGWLYGAEYAGYGFEMRLLILASMLQIGLGANGILLNMTKRDNIAMYGVIGRAVASIGLSALLIPWIGLLAVVVGFTLALVGQNVYYRLKIDGNK